MDESTYEEINSILAKNGRPDLIAEMKSVKSQIVDEDYKPPIRARKDSLSDSEGSAEEENIDSFVDENGFHSLQ
tara:strand:- start:420 stop:641 length:222 start_codon:yes stop_codon:yes gene_type:complete